MERISLDAVETELFLSQSLWWCDYQRELDTYSCSRKAFSFYTVLQKFDTYFFPSQCVLANIDNDIRLSVGAGSDNDLVKIYNHGRIYAKRVIAHPQFDTSNLANDIALLELEQPLSLSDTILPGCLDTERARKNYGDVVIAGYGLTTKVIVDMRNGEPLGKYSSSRFLKELDYKDISETGKKCESFKGILCVDSRSGIRESGCYGDSGGPMHKTENGKTTIIGVTSGSDYNLFKDHYVIFCNGKYYNYSLECALLASFRLLS